MDVEVGVEVEIEELVGEVVGDRVLEVVGEIIGEVEIVEVVEKMGEGEDFPQPCAFHWERMYTHIEQLHEIARGKDCGV